MKNPTRLEQEYLALCWAIEREATGAGYVQFLKNPNRLRSHVRQLSKEFNFPYPTLPDHDIADLLGDDHAQI